jgi:transketolase
MTDVLQPVSVPSAETDRLAVDTLRFLAADMVQAAGCGHPGMPMGAAPMAWTLWSRHLRHDPADPAWADRDRFVLSAGHGSALLYGLLHIFGYDLAEADLRRFRQLGSRTPGHPEFGHTPGVTLPIYLDNPLHRVFVHPRDPTPGQAGTSAAGERRRHR